MKTVFALGAALAATVNAAPAIVWSSGSSADATVEHTSDAVGLSSVLSSVMDMEGNIGRRKLNSSPMSLESVIFLVGRDSDGGEGLSHLASSGKLPQVSAMYNEAAAVHHHVDGVEGSGSVRRLTGKATGDKKLVETNLREFNRRLSEDFQADVEQGKLKDKRSRALAQADILIVSASVDEAANLDSAVSRALSHDSVGSVVLTATRSTEEVKRERSLLAKQKLFSMQQTARRRLEDQQVDDAMNDANQNNAYNEDLEGIYYVTMTPNIFAGILYTIFFFVVAHIGISCMGNIAGQDVYCDKYPYIGREA